MSDRLLRLRDVMAITGLGSSTLYRYIQAGTFPAPMKIGGFTARWRESAVEAWMDGLTPKDLKGGVSGGVLCRTNDGKTHAPQ